MLAKEITSLQHPIVKHLVQLKKERVYRVEQQSVLLMGDKLIQEVAAHLPLKMLLVEKGAPCRLKAEELFVVPCEIIKKITGLKNPEHCVAVVSMPPSCTISSEKFLLALDGISDPGNLGTLLRTALALNWQAVFITNSSTDPYNDKALRAAKGATFRLPLMQGSWEDLNVLIKKHQMHVFVADKQGTQLSKITPQTPILLVLGNEAHGASSFAKERYKRICIPMNPQMESLNVASAGAILMYQLRTGS